MLDDKIKQIQSEIKTDTTLNEAERAKLLTLSQELHEELTHLEKTHQHDAQHIAEQAHKTVQGASIETATGLKEVVQKFEISHPNLTRIIQALCAQFGV